MLGCGNGELDWESQVKPLMEEYLSGLPIEILIHKYPFKAVFLPEHRDVPSMKRWLRSEPWSLGFDEVWGDIVELIGEGRSFTTSARQEVYRVALIEDGQTVGI
jgi:hypothetical protein